MKRDADHQATGWDETNKYGDSCPEGEGEDAAGVRRLIIVPRLGRGKGSMPYARRRGVDVYRWLCVHGTHTLCNGAV